MTRAMSRVAMLMFLVAAAGAAATASAQAPARDGEAFTARFAEFQAFRSELGAEIATLSLLRSGFEVLARMARTPAAESLGDELIIVPGAIRARVCGDDVTRDWCELLPDRFREPFW